jgi:hypothetical protein
VPKSVRIVAAAVAALVVLVLAAQRVQALGPTVLMFYGGTLKNPVFVTGLDVELFGDVNRRSTITPDELGSRTYLNVALFWGPARDPALNGTPMASLTPAMAWQHGRFYPPAGKEPALLLTTQLTKSTQPVPVPSNGPAFIAGGPLPDTALPALRKLGLVPAGRQSISR